MGRYFIGITPRGLAENLELKQLVGKMKRTLADREREARWVPPEFRHITLAFLGSLDDGELDRAEGVLENWTPPSQDLTLEVHGIGAFPTPMQARVLWAGIQTNQDFLDLQSSLAAHLKLAGFKLEEREFQPHLTLARLRNPQSVADLVSLGGRKHFGSYPVEEAILFESVIQGKMTKYVPLLRRKLQ